VGLRAFCKALRQGVGKQHPASNHDLGKRCSYPSFEVTSSESWWAVSEIAVDYDVARAPPSRCGACQEGWGRRNASGVAAWAEMIAILQRNWSVVCFTSGNTAVPRGLSSISTPSKNCTGGKHAYPGASMQFRRFPHTRSILRSVAQ
jgi:hypothetical protein